MKIIVSILLFTGIMGLPRFQSESMSCVDFKNGKFTYQVGDITIKLEREADFQIEKSPFGDNKYKMVWLSDCSFDLKLIESTVAVCQKNIGKKYHIEILSIDENKFTTSCILEGETKVDTSVTEKVIN